MTYSGGCLCGAIRYESTQGPTETGYCHCSLCRRSTGAPVSAYCSFPVESFHYTGGTPTIYHSSATGQREFCAQCGTQICFREIHSPKTVDINSGTLDDCEAVAPTLHIYTADKIGWFETADQLPRYPQSN